MGLLFIIMGVFLFLFPVYGGTKELLNSLTFIIVGAVFLYYGLTGKSQFIRFKPKK